MRISAFCTAVLTYVVIGHPPPAVAQVDQQRAQKYFKEAQAMNAFSGQPATDATAAATRYGGAELRASEQKREQERQERLAELRRQFVDGPVLVIRGGGSTGSDSRGAVVIPGSGTMYFGAFKASGTWGTLEAERGVLVATDGLSRQVSAPVRRDDGTFIGDGWTFKAAPGWVVREGARRGDYEVVRQQP